MARATWQAACKRADKSGVKCSASPVILDELTDHETTTFFLLDFDGKMRYADAQRLEVYRFLVPLLRKAFPETVVYLCMEDPQIVKAING